MVTALKKEIGIIGLGKMGGNIARRLMQKGWPVSGYDPSEEAMKRLSSEGVHTQRSPLDLVDTLAAPRLFWVMVPAGKPVDDVLFGSSGIAAKLSKGDTVIDGGNSYYKDSITRSEKLARQGVRFIDVGASGGPFSILKSGACLMIGGDEATFKEFEPLFRDIALPDGYQFFEGAGAGHFVKMIHNGIEYGMMQAIGEGFAVLKRAPFSLDLTRVADVYAHGSIVESRLIGWLKSGFEQHGTELADVSGTIGYSGEGEWTVKTAKEMKMDVPVIENSLKFRMESSKNPSYVGKIVSVLREQFGGHPVKKEV